MSESDTLKNTTRADIVIAGAGYVGLATAVSIAQAQPSLSIRIVDAAPQGVWQKDERASAIAAAACRMLEQLGCWDDIAPHAQAITEMIVTDSKTADPVRPVLLTFSGEVAAGEPFAHMVPNKQLNAALRAKAQTLGIVLTENVSVIDFSAGPNSTRLNLSNGEAVDASLLIAADGVKSRLRDKAGIRTVHWDYGQSGIVCTVKHERPHHGRAVEHFLPSGPFAILPLTGNRSSIVWTEKTAEAERLVNADPLIFESELELRFGLELGEIRAENKPRAFPLSLTLARDFVRPRFALVGDAAHGIHPIAGQGLNLGFKDAAALAETVAEAARMGQDIGALDILENYQRWRRFDTLRMGATTDVLNRLFSNESSGLRSIRDIGLGLVERMPALKSYFIGQAASQQVNEPRLLQGKPI